ncbi:MAG: hypothetical protein ACLPVF_07615 [Acidimicrobiales bacterium]
MILRFEMPTLDANAMTTRMYRWHKVEGDEISYGDDICEVVVEETKRLVRNLHASDVLDETAKKKSRKPTGSGPTKRTANYVVRIVSSDLGSLRRITAPEGEILSAGDTLALITSEAGEGLPHQVDGSWPTFRVVWDHEMDDPYE